MSVTKESILEDLENDKLPLPTLPEVAIRVRSTVDDENASMGDIANIISTDPALSARIVQVANSALYQSANPAENVRAAVMRMGMDTVRNLTTSLVMKQMFQASHPVVDKYLRRTWKQSTDVAALSAIIAKHHTDLPSENALLAGLTHSIGVSPILVKAEDDGDLLENLAVLDALIKDLHPTIGKAILKKWDFAPELAEVPAEYLNTNHQGANGKADYVDVVQVALMQLVSGTEHILARTDPTQISALDRLNMRESIEEIVMDSSSEASDLSHALG